MSYNSVVLADSPAGFWPLNEASGASAADLAASPHNGTYGTGVTYGRPGIGDGTTAVGFDGSAGTGVATTLMTVNAATFSLEVWLKPAAGATFYGIIGKTNGNASAPYDSYCNSSGSITFFASGAANFAVNLTFGAWNHLVMTWDGTSARQYINGALSDTKTGPTTGTDNTGKPVRIGNRDDSGTPFKGDMAKAAVYNSVLSLAQVSAHYAAQNQAAGTNTTTAFEAELLAQPFTKTDRGMMAGAAYRLRQNYQRGMTDPAAHTVALANSEYTDVLNANNEMTNFNAITAV